MVTIYALLRRGGSRAAATSKMERFVLIVNGFQPAITKRSILDVAAALDPPLLRIFQISLSAAITIILILSKSEVSLITYFSIRDSPTHLPSPKFHMFLNA